MAPFPFQIRQLPTALQDFASEMENIVETVLNQSGCSNAACDKPAEATFAPPLDIVEDESGFSLYLDLPGVESNGLKVELLEDKLHLCATRTATPLNAGAVVHRGERTLGKFARSIRLPKQIDAERIAAELKHGVLHLRLPKVPKATSRQIEIRTGD
ncbi:MAG: Hsp20/alpha crystallin family protein [Planctomycetota bacterium]|jgi:HSP20 family protein